MRQTETFTYFSDNLHLLSLKTLLSVEKTEFDATMDVKIINKSFAMHETTRYLHELIDHQFNKSKLISSSSVKSKLQSK